MKSIGISVGKESIIDYIQYAQEKGCSMQGPERYDISTLNVLKEGTY